MDPKILGPRMNKLFKIFYNLQKKPKTLGKKGQGCISFFYWNLFIVQVQDTVVKFSTPNILV